MVAKQTIRIKEGVATGENYRVFLGDMDISDFVNRMVIDIQAQGVTSITLTVVGNVELPDALTGVIVATKEETA
jgi:hypothetical protein